jgi:hypothetical protein
MPRRKSPLPEPVLRQKPAGGATRSVTIAGEPAPKLPNERDESPDSAGNEPREIIQQAHDDLESGKQDTDRGPVMDRTYRKLKK